MKRPTIYLLILLATAASAPATLAPPQLGTRESHSTNETVIEKNQAFPRVGPFVVEECLDTSCTLTRG